MKDLRSSPGALAVTWTVAGDAVGRAFHPSLSGLTSTNAGFHGSHAYGINANNSRHITIEALGLLGGQTPAEEVDRAILRQVRGDLGLYQRIDQHLDGADVVGIAAPPSSATASFSTRKTFHTNASPRAAQAGTARTLQTASSNALDRPWE